MKRFALLLACLCTLYVSAQTGGTASETFTVQDVEGYNSWPVIQNLGKKLVCVYCRGKAHNITEDGRAVYARTSTDCGRHWTDETIVANTPLYGEVTIGKGLDEKGEMLLFVRRIGKEWNHDLYRTSDGRKFDLVTTLRLDPMPIQITDIFKVPNVGLMALWFAGTYDAGRQHSWGTLVSRDGGQTWQQHVVEDGLEKGEWPTEPSAVYLGNGRILAVARTELDDADKQKYQFQMVSTDYGRTWQRSKTDINDVYCSTPTLILDKKTGLLSNYYYYRGKGTMWRRVVKPDAVFKNPKAWPEPQLVTTGSTSTFDAGNVNATAIGRRHFVAFYSGKAPDTSILVTAVKAPDKKSQKAPSPASGKVR